MSKVYKSQGLFEDINNQPLAIELLESILEKKRIAPAYIFSGPKGVGQVELTIRFLEGLITGGYTKPSIRKMLSEYNYPDLLWVEPTYTHKGNLIEKSKAKGNNFISKKTAQIRLEQIREIKSFLSNQAIETELGMIVIEDAETMNEAASNALLKTLEEPPKGILVLISSRVDQMLTTIKSRCQLIPFQPFSYNVIRKLFLENIKDSKLDKSLINYEVELIRLSNGSPEVLEENIQIIQEIPSQLLSALKALPSNYLEALNIAKDIHEGLSLENQLWLIKFLQVHFWNKDNNLEIITLLEKLQSLLSSSIQPRIAWEVTLIDLIS